MDNRTDDQIRQAARDGAALLDNQAPGWANQVEVTDLDLEDCRACVLGQIYAGEVEDSSGYDVGVRELSGFSDSPFALDFGSQSALFAWKHGFLGLNVHEYALLDGEWRRLIAERA